MGKVIYSDNLSKLILGDSFDVMSKMKNKSIDVIIADPPYFLSNNGFSNSGGKLVSVNKGKWDKGNFDDAKYFYVKMLKEFKRIISDNGTIWLFGTMHNIFILGYLAQKEGFKILNNITWQKSNPVPNLSCRMFTHSTENILWLKKENGKQVFNYQLMRQINGNKQMKDVWTTATINRAEKRFGNHPTQKPLAIIDRIIKASTQKDMLVLDPFVGSGTTLVASRLNKIRCIGIDSNETFVKIAQQRLINYKTEKIGKVK